MLKEYWFFKWRLPLRASMVEKTKCESWLEETTAANPQSATGNPQSKWTGTRLFLEIPTNLFGAAVSALESWTGIRARSLTSRVLWDWEVNCLQNQTFLIKSPLTLYMAAQNCKKVALLLKAFII